MSSSATPDPRVIGPSARLRAWVKRSWAGNSILPSLQPIFVQSWLYVMGVLTLCTFGLLILSGVILAVKGAFWWHYSSLGRFVNSTHFWSVILFFLFMSVHLFHGFWMGAWRGGQRWFTWVTGAALFMICIVTAFFGYNLQTNFGSQWIGTQGKDAVNSTGLGGIANILDAGQMYSMHVILLPLLVAAIVVIHVLWVRKDGVVPPYARRAEELRDAVRNRDGAGANDSGRA
jgi:ubiquinol-cytochrome c reductase cytochrome b subunit